MTSCADSFSTISTATRARPRRSRRPTKSSGSAISTADEVVWIGSDPAEYWEGGHRVRAIVAQQMQDLFQVRQELGRAPIAVSDVKIRAFEHEDFGWATVTFLGETAEDIAVEWRITFVLRYEAPRWKIIHQHASNPVPNIQSMGTELTTSLEEIAHLVERERPDVGSATSPDGTVTIVFTDLEASTATNEAIGDEAFLPLLLKHNEIIRARTKEQRGTVVKSLGDGFMLAFPSARRAVDCAIAIQQEVSSLDDRFKVRMGLHTGEPIRRENDFYGRDVAYAARVGSAATGGEILVSSLVKSLVQPSGSVSFTEDRELDLKGFDGAQHVHVVAW